jgi:RsiW-degrading membrane proteinase PrsW (M82 family)
MGATENYGALRVVSVDNPVRVGDRHSPNFFDRIPEERLVHLVTRPQVTIGRALSNDLILLDSSVSRVHACLSVDGQGWHLKNMSEQNLIRVNGHAVPFGRVATLHPQDIFVLGSTSLQLVAPQSAQTASIPQTPPQPPNDHHQVASGLQANVVSLPPVHAEKEDDRASGLLFPSTGMRRWKSIPFAALDAARQVRKVEQRAGKAFGVDYTNVHKNAWSTSRRFRLQYGWIVLGIIFLAVLLGAGVTILFINVLGFSTLVQDVLLNSFVALTIPLIPAIGINLLVSLIDRFEREPLFLRLGAFFWGALIAIPATVFIEQSIQDRRLSIIGLHPNIVASAFFYGINAGITEETTKGLGLLLLFLVLRDEFDNVTDGIVYGALIGAGFAMVENFSYFATNPQSVVLLVIERIVLSWLVHSTFTACFGAALGSVRHASALWQRILVPFAGYMAAVGLHSLFDFANLFINMQVVAYHTSARVVTYSLLAVAANYILPFIVQIVLLYCLIKSLAHESEIIREFLAEEVRDGIVTVDEYVLLQHTFVRARVERHVLFNSGVKQWRRVKALYQAEIDLAFRKWHVSMGDRAKPGPQQPEQDYRQRIRTLHTQIAQEEHIHI